MNDKLQPYVNHLEYSIFKLFYLDRVLVHLHCVLTSSYDSVKQILLTAQYNVVGNKAINKDEAYILIHKFWKYGQDVPLQWEIPHNSYQKHIRIYKSLHFCYQANISFVKQMREEGLQDQHCVRTELKGTEPVDGD